MNAYKTAAAFAVVGQLIAANAHASCGAAFCSVNTDVDVHGTASAPALRLDLRYEYIEQDRLRAGTQAASPSGEPGEHDEVTTRNRNLVTTFDYQSSNGLGVLAQIPYVDRHHEHVFNDPILGPQPETWDYRALGDVRVLGRYQIGNAPVYGIKFGVKLPTGGIHEENSEGERAERTLQPGTGSTDVIAGAYWSTSVADGMGGAFAQVLWQHPVTTREEYTPGDQVTADAGGSYALTASLSALLQLNIVMKQRDSGANAEPADSGGKFVSLSPGLSYAWRGGWVGYAFMQESVFQDVNGTQLTPRYAVVAGASRRF